MKLTTALAALGFTFLPATAPAAAVVFFSERGFGEGASLGNPLVELGLSDSAELHIFFTPDPADNRYRSIALNVTTSDSSVASATGFSILNPGVTIAGSAAGMRWNGTNGSLGSGMTLVSNMAGVAVTAPGLDVLNSGIVGLDAGYDPSAGSFYFGSITVQANSIGTISLFLSTGSTLIVREGDAVSGNPALVQFGAAGIPVSGQDLAVAGAIEAARITVIPEPQSAALLTLALAVCCARRRNR